MPGARKRTSKVGMDGLMNGLYDRLLACLPIWIPRMLYLLFSSCPCCARNIRLLPLRFLGRVVYPFTCSHSRLILFCASHPHVISAMSALLPPAFLSLLELLAHALASYVSLIISAAALPAHPPPYARHLLPRSVVQSLPVLSLYTSSPMCIAC